MKYKVIQYGWDPITQGTEIQESILCSCLDEAQVYACMITPLTLKQVQTKCKVNGIPIYKDSHNRLKYIINEDTIIYEE